MTIQISYEKLWNLAQKFAPMVYLHPDEPYFPCSVEWFLERTRLENRANNQGDVGPPVQQDLLPTAGSNSYLNICDDSNKEATKKGEAPINGVSSTFCYVHAIAPSGAPSNIIELQYLFCYAFNGGGVIHFESYLSDHLSSDVNTGDLGNHQGDWEHITVRVNVDTEEFVMAYYSEHTYGRWLNAASSQGDPDGVSFYPDRPTSPIVYSALRSHASYAAPGSYQVFERYSDPTVHIYGVADIGVNDLTASGTQWKTWENLKLIQADNIDVTGSPVTPPPDWLQYTGLWGGPIVNYIGAKQQAELIISAAEANPIIAGFLHLLTPVTPLIAVIEPLVVLFTREHKEGPKMPPTSTYWKNGEVGSSSIQVETVESGSKEVKVKFGPVRSIATFATGKQAETRHYIFYVRHSDNKLRYNWGTDGSNWQENDSWTGKYSHSSPATTVYSHNATTYLYAFYLDSEGAIYYWVQGAIGDLQVNYEPTASSIPNPNTNTPAVAIWGNKCYLAYWDSNNQISLTSGQVNNKTGEISNPTGLDFTQVSPSPPWADMTAMKGSPSIAVYNDRLYIVWPITSGGVELWWYTPSGWHKPSQQPHVDHCYAPTLVVVHGTLFMIYCNNNSIYQTCMDGSDDSSPWSAYSKVGLQSENKILGAAAGGTTPLYLIYRNDDEETLATTPVYL